MGTRPRLKPARLPAKLYAIRMHLALSQSELVARINLDLSPARICEYERGTREPNSLVLLRYSQIAGIHMEVLIDDRVDLPKKFAP